jgi:hypothetical protein
MLLGDWGVDTSNHSVWAVVNFNDQFSVEPEPSANLLMVFGLIGVCYCYWLRSEHLVRTEA